MGPAVVKQRSYFYLAGLFVTALGSMTYAATLPAVMYEMGISALFIGILIGTMRLNGFLVNTFLGHIGDKYNPRTVLILCEFGAAMGSILILLSWKTWGASWLLPFVIANNIRVFFTALQAGSTQKLGKNFDGLLDLKGRFAVYISGASNGALLLGGLLAMAFYQYLDIEKLVLFDAATFIVNGLIVFFVQKSSEHRVSNPGKKTISVNVLSYYKALPVLAVFDSVLSLALSGANTLNLRLLEGSPELVPLMPTLFGGVAFVVSTLAVDKKFHANNKFLWVVLAASLILQGAFAGSPAVVISMTVIRNLAYWIIYNCISREVMKNAPRENFSAIASGRGALNVCVLALGEFWVGATKAIPVVYEMLWRSVVALAASLLPKRVRDEK